MKLGRGELELEELIEVEKQMEQERINDLAHEEVSTNLVFIIIIIIIIRGMAKILRVEIIRVIDSCCL